MPHAESIRHLNHPPLTSHTLNTANLHMATHASLPTARPNLPPLHPYARPRDLHTERAVLSFPPYTPRLLSHWRFANPTLAHTSSSTLLRFFHHFRDVDDWIGADMTRKFLQMGVTRARRYANYRSGRKYVRDAREVRTGEVREKRVSAGGGVIEGQDGDGVGNMGEDERRKVQEKVESSLIFGRVLEEVRACVWYEGARGRYWDRVGELEAEGWKLGEDGVVYCQGEKIENEATDRDKKGKRDSESGVDSVVDEEPIADAVEDKGKRRRGGRDDEDVSTRDTRRRKKTRP